MKPTEIDSLSYPELEPYRTMRRPVEHREKGIFVAEGEKVVRRLVASDLRIVSMLMTREWWTVYSSLLKDRELEDGLFIAEKKLLEEIVGYGLHQGIMAIARVPAPKNASRLLTSSDGPLLLVALDGIANTENMGVIVRNCAAFGVNALIVGETSCDPYLRRSVRNSMGTIFTLPIVYATDLAAEMSSLRSKHAITLIAAHPRPGSRDITSADLTGSVCVVFGSEGEGISSKVLAVCESEVSIPMRRDVDSVNVATSVGIFLFEAVRQRKIWNGSTSGSAR